MLKDKGRRNLYGSSSSCIRDYLSSYLLRRVFSWTFSYCGFSNGHRWYCSCRFSKEKISERNSWLSLIDYFNRVLFYSSHCLVYRSCSRSGDVNKKSFILKRRKINHASFFCIWMRQLEDISSIYEIYI